MSSWHCQPCGDLNKKLKQRNCIYSTQSRQTYVARAQDKQIASETLASEQKIKTKKKQLNKFIQMQVVVNIYLIFVCFFQFVRFCHLSSYFVMLIRTNGWYSVFVTFLFSLVHDPVAMREVIYFAHLLFRSYTGYICRCARNLFPRKFSNSLYICK